MNTDDQHICFASNTALAQRTHVSVQTVERHISLLVHLGLVRRVSSPNGKRWARRDQQGRVVLATGISLLPLAERHAELLQTAEEYIQETLKLSILRDKCSIALTKLKSLLKDHSAISSLLDHARNVLRRRPNANALSKLLEEISVEISEHTQAMPGKLRGTDTEK